MVVGLATGCSEFHDKDHSEPPNMLRTNFGGECTLDSECMSGFCVETEQGSVCTHQCSIACPQGWHCMDAPTQTRTDQVRVCVPGNRACDCTNKQCGDNGCGTLCGFCNPSEECVNSQCVEMCTNECDVEGERLCDHKRIMECGNFDADPCLELGELTPCKYLETCQHGECVCTPNCEGKQCGSDGCGGICGECNGDTTCSLNQCSETCESECHSLGEKRCVAGGGGVQTCGQFDADDCLDLSPVSLCDTGSECVEGQCQCTPQCPPNSCGDDGCGGSCGVCTDGLSCSNGICVDDCINECDTIGASVCTPDGSGIHSCGNFDDDKCLEWGSESACNDGKCLNGQCVCVAQCNGKECGDNGCGGDCGQCGNGSICDEGICVLTCTDQCSSLMLTKCSNNKVKVCGQFDDDPCLEWGPSQQCSISKGCTNGCQCQPNCEGKKCGSDGCGGQCGSCGPGAECMGNECVANCTNECDAIGETDCVGVKAIRFCGQYDDDGCLEWSPSQSCKAGDLCLKNTCECAPSCNGKQCGDDGCGGTCGSCGNGVLCENHTCVCTPTCDGKVCGDDGCGGLCGDSKHCGVISYYGKSSGSVWSSQIIEFKDTHAPKRTIEAAFYDATQHTLWVVTDETYHVLKKQNWTWVNSGDRDELFPELSGKKITSMWNVPKAQTGGQFDNISVTYMSPEPKFCNYWVNFKENKFFLANNLSYSFLQNQMAPKANTILASWIVLDNKQGVPAQNFISKLSPKNYCTQAKNIGVMGAHLSVITTLGSIHFREHEYCYEFMAAVPVTDVDYFQQPAAPKPTALNAVTWTDDVLVTLRSPKTK